MEARLLLEAYKNATAVAFHSI